MSRRRCLTIDQARRGLEAACSVNDGRETVGPVMTVLGVAADALAIPAHHQPVAVMLDLVHPQWTGRRSLCLGRLARFDEAGRTQDDHGRRIEQQPGGSTATAATS
jgi:hypothetical protein